MPGGHATARNALKHGLTSRFFSPIAREDIEGLAVQLMLGMPEQPLVYAAAYEVATLMLRVQSVDRVRNHLVQETLGGLAAEDESDVYAFTFWPGDLDEFGHDELENHYGVDAIDYRISSHEGLGMMCRAYARLGDTFKSLAGYERKFLSQQRKAIQRFDLAVIDALDRGYD